jgi:hypothetical protein
LNKADTVAEIESGFSGDPSGFAKRWEEYQQRNRLTKPENWKGNVQ